MENLFVIDSTTNEGTSKSIFINSEADFVQQGKITKLELSEDNKFYMVNFTNKAGQSLKYDKRYYLPKDKSEYADEEKYKKAVQIFLSNMANLGRKFKGEDYKVEGSSALDVALKVIGAVKPLLNKEIFAFFELEKKDKGIFPNLGSFSPFGTIKEELMVKINAKQKELLEEKRNYKTSPDSDGTAVSFNETPKPTDDLPF